MLFKFFEKQPFTQMRPDIKTNILVFYITEDVFNDPEFKVGQPKYKQLENECKLIILNYIDKLPFINKSDDSKDIVTKGNIYFNFNKTPDITVDKSNLHDILDMIRDLTAFATELALGTKLERKGRKSFRRPGGPDPYIVATNCKPKVKEELTSLCLGCMGFATIFEDPKNDKTIK